MTKRIMRQATVASAVAAGAVLLFGGAAHAGTDIVSVGNNGIGNGNQVYAPIQAPINICGNAIAVLGVAGAGCDGGASADMGGHHHHHHHESMSVTESGVNELLPAGLGELAGGLPVGQLASTLPAGDTAMGLGNGLPTSGITGGVTGSQQQDVMSNVPNRTTERAPVLEYGTDMVSAGNNGILNGNQIYAPIQVPINVCGNAIALLGGVAGAGCDGGADADMESGATGDMMSAGNNGIANGNQVQVPVQVPVDVSGNAVGALVGLAGAGSTGGADADMG